MGIREARGLGFNRSSLRRPDEGERVHGDIQIASAVRPVKVNVIALSCEVA